jgi:hypothetical protein
MSSSPLNTELEPTPPVWSVSHENTPLDHVSLFEAPVHVPTPVNALPVNCEADAIPIVSKFVVTEALPGNNRSDGSDSVSDEFAPPSESVICRDVPANARSNAEEAVFETVM